MYTERNRVVKARAKKLDIEIIHGVTDKKAILKNYCKEKRHNLKKVLYIGNDLNDLEAMKAVGYPIAPQDADKKVKSVAKVVLAKKGGNGVVRELYEKVINNR